MAAESIKEILDYLRITRLKKRLSQSDLAAKLGVPQSHISKIESGKINPTLSLVIEIARTLDCELTLIPKKYTIAVKSMLKAQTTHSKNLPAYTLRDDEEDENG
jgi:transcriptional regulator with XRE-family HTH domain